MDDKCIDIMSHLPFLPHLRPHRARTPQIRAERGRPLSRKQEDEPLFVKLGYLVICDPRFSANKVSALLISI